MSHRNQGAFLLARTSKTQADIAARLGVSRTVVVYWLSCERLPKLSHREALQRAYKIPVDAWDEPIVTAPRARKKAAVPPPEPAIADELLQTSAREIAWGLVRDIEHLRREARTDKSVTLMERTKVYDATEAMLMRLGKITGQTLEISEARILRLPAWARIQERLIHVLSAWPEVLRAVGEEIQKMGGET